MRIVLVSTGSSEFDQFPNGGGIQHQISDTAQELSKRGHEPIVITRDKNANLPEGVIGETTEVNFPDEIFSRILFGRQAAGIINQYAPDAVFAYERFSALFPCQTPYPLLFITENYDAMTFYKEYALNRHPLNRIVFPFKKRIEEYVMRKSDRVIALNSDIEEYLHDRGINHTSIVPNAVNPAEYQYCNEDDFILYAGRLDGVKNVQLLIKAFQKIASEYPETVLRIAGDGEERTQLERNVQKLGLEDQVEFMGWVDRSLLSKYFSRCQLFVLPSEFETFGIVILEAMASGKPVIASDCMGPRNIITDQEDGLLFPKNDKEKLADAIQFLLSDPDTRQELGESAQETVAQSYSFSSIVNNLVRISKEIRSSNH